MFASPKRLRGGSNPYCGVTTCSMFLLKYKLLCNDGNMRKGLCGCACRPETGELPSTIWGNRTRAHPSVRTCWPGPWCQRCQNRWIKDGNEISVENFRHSAAHAEARREQESWQRRSRPGRTHWLQRKLCLRRGGKFHTWERRELDLIRKVL